MRQLKVRVWHQGFEKFLSKEEWFLDLDGNLRFFDVGYWKDDKAQLKAVNKNFYIIQEYTGLKDKNGSEIYEGDVVKVVTQHGNYLNLFRPYAGPILKGDLFKVVHLLSGFTLCKLSNDWETPSVVGNVNNYALWNGAGQLEVIGNIFQNPELLK